MVKVTKKQSLTDDSKKNQTQKSISEINKAEEENAFASLAEKYGLPYVDLNLFPVSADDLRLIPEEEAQKGRLAVFQKNGKQVKIAITDPVNPETLKTVEKLKTEHGWQPVLFVVSETSLKRVLEKYKSLPFIENLDIYKTSLTGKDLEDFDREFGDLLKLKERIREIPTTQVVNTIMAGAIKMKASDIHFEPQEKEVRLRYRLDGVLQDIGYLPEDVYRFIVSRVKMMGKMKINLRLISQDGHFSISLDQSRIDVRVNIIPGSHGESIVMRLLNQADVLVSVEDLGLRGLAYEQVQKQIAKPNGMILTTGPTGSGKTTTLYALVNKLNTSDVKIITIEDPVEYEVKGISQTQVSKDKGYTFAKGLRAIVRQDPDVILVGEIRDEETADIAVNAALTGHLVLSTLHTNNAAASIPRFIEMGVKPNLIPPSVNAFMAQRLVRKLCPLCREEYKPATETVESIKKILALVSPKSKVEIPKTIDKLYRPKGCPKCHNLGYKGRIGIFEVLTINDKIEKLISEMAGEGDIAKEAIENGMITMTQDGILKAVEGVTSLEEVWRVTGQTEFLESIYEQLMEQTLSRSVLLSGDDLRKVETSLSSIGNFQKMLEGANQKDVVRYVLGGGLMLEAGDVHVEPTESHFLIRFRIDGILQTVAKVPITEYPSFLGEIKMLSGFKTEVREGVKDSRFAIVAEELVGKIKEPKTDVRVSIILGGYGETVVMRLLNKSAVALDINYLGIRKQNLDKILHEIKKPHGFFLNTGPTGSGKTTTLYSLIKILNTPEVKIITVEDPIEYQLEGILQTQVNSDGGYTFPTALRALMRQNPDVMMIGEIRDNETADIAVQSALTGHLVLSTLHTNDAPGAVPRLINMGVRSDDLATSANGFMAQRLVRKLCDCKEKAKIKEEDLKKMIAILETISPKAGVEVPKVIEQVYQPKGCEKCNGIGYKGRTTVSEILVIDREIRELIAQNALSVQLRDKAIANGMITMLQDGILKVTEGETTLEEVERVASEE